MKQKLVVLAILSYAACGGPTPPTPLAPQPASINPTSGTSLGGTTVTVTGANFDATSSVTLGGTAATNVSVGGGGSSLTATTAAHAPGKVDVVVRNASSNLSGTIANGFEYLLVPALRSNPGGPYSVDAERDITMNGLASTSSPFPIAHYFWNCGQTPKTGKTCDQDTPTPTFEYIKTGKIGSPNVVYTVTLRIVDTMGNSDTATTTVSVRQVY